jgi:hypothetical protein
MLFPKTISLGQGQVLLTEQANKSKLVLAIIGAYASVFDQQFFENSLVEFNPRRPSYC